MAAAHVDREDSANAIAHSYRLSRLREQWHLRMEPYRVAWPATRHRSRYSHREWQRPLAVERLTYHALLAGLQALLAQDYAGALTIAAAPAFIASTAE